MVWKEVSVLTEGVCVEAIADIFHRLGSGGVVIEDPQAARKYISKDKYKPDIASPDFLEHEFVVVKAYFPEDKAVLAEIDDCLEKVRESFNVDCKVYVCEVDDEDWEESWKKYYHTFKIGERIVIKPSWEEYDSQSNEIVVEIDPGMAFGTGIHASTRFCLRFIDEYIKGGESIVDAGCGSGILSIAAVKLGAKRVWGMDIDEVAVKVATENVELNKLADKITIQEGNIVEELINYKPDLVLANITAEIVSLLIPKVAEVLPVGGYLFGSGIVDSRWPGVKKQLEDNNFIIEKTLTDVDWVGVVAKKA
ncbi:MAG TPA: 50S ribosomal protein L11 methyltransferase [Syntrophomonadaceae bacterium]|nr:50S ribosomal protein L11 methyltransferase [Syntrophomonadaceae bacterium]